MDWKEWEDTTTIDKAFFVNFWQGPFNDWGAGKDIPHQMEQNDDGLWELEMMATWPTYMQLNVGALTISSMVMWTAMVFLTVFLPTRLRPTTSKYLPLPLLISLGPFLWMTRLRLGPWSLEDELLLVPPYLRSFWLLPLLLVSSPLSSYGIEHNRYGVKAKTSNYFPIFGNKSPIPHYWHVSHQWLSWCSGPHLPPSQGYSHLLVSSQCRIPRSLASSYKGRGEGSLHGIQH